MLTRLPEDNLHNQICFWSPHKSTGELNLASDPSYEWKVAQVRAMTVDLRVRDCHQSKEYYARTAQQAA